MGMLEYELDFINSGEEEDEVSGMDGRELVVDDDDRDDGGEEAAKMGLGELLVPPQVPPLPPLL